MSDRDRIEELEREVERLREELRIAYKYGEWRCSYCGYTSPQYHEHATGLFAAHLETCSGTLEMRRLRAIEASAKTWAVGDDRVAPAARAAARAILAGTEP